MTMAGLTPAASNTSSQKGRIRQKRRSFSTNSREAPNSCASSAPACSLNSSALGERYQPGLKASQSCQLEPADSRSASLKSATACDSQCPVSLLAAPPINVLGRSQPSRLNTRASAEVPERCMPATTSAVFGRRRGCATGSPTSAMSRGADADSARDNLRSGCDGELSCMRSSVAVNQFLRSHRPRSFMRNAHEMLPIAAFQERFGEREQLDAVDEAHTISDLLDAGNGYALAVLDRAHKLHRLDQGVMGTGVQPSVTTAELLDVELAPRKILTVNISDLELAARRGRKPGSNIKHPVVVKIESGHHPVGARARRLFLQRACAAFGAELDHTIALGIVHLVGENSGAAL